MLTENEKNLINCLTGSSEFLQKVINEGLLDYAKYGVLKMFIMSQIESNNMTVREINKKKYE